MRVLFLISILVHAYPLILTNISIFDEVGVQTSVQINELVEAQAVSVQSWKAGVQMQLDLVFTQAEYDTYISIDNQFHKLCLMVDGKRCECQGALDVSHRVILSQTCVPDFSFGSSLWFSISLHNLNLTQAVVSTPIKIINFDHHEANVQTLSKITLLLPLTLDDLSRALVLLHTLHLASSEAILEMHVYAPDKQLSLIENALEGSTRSLSFPVLCRPESLLFERGSDQWKMKAYGLQMAIKLLAAKYIKTSYYLTLDADLFLLRTFNISQIIASSPRARAIYRPESILAHPHWWQGSRSLLGLEGVDLSAAFGVTPSVLSTWGSLLTLQTIKEKLCSGAHEVYCSKENDCTGVCEDFEEMWLDSFGAAEGGTLWTEYTLYRTVLDYFQIFNLLHITEQEHGVYLTCNEVWYKEQLPWEKQKAHQNSTCLFSLIQSSSGFSSSSLVQIVMD